MDLEFNKLKAQLISQEDYMIVNKQFLPISMNDLKERNISQLDFIIITGDAYIDHPSFGTAIIGRTLEREGFTVGTIAQPIGRVLTILENLANLNSHS